MNFLKSRITLRNDTVENWEKSKKKIMLGEAVLGRIKGSQDFQLKIGTGDRTWKELDTPNILIPAEKVQGLDSLSAGLADQISGKIFVSDPDSGFSGFADLSVVKLGRDEYEGLVTSGKTIPNCLYVVSSDTGNMYGRRLENLAAPETGTDAANRYYVDAGLSGKADLSGDVEFRSAYAERLSSHTAYSASLSVMNVYGKFLNRGVRFMNTYNGKQSYLIPDGSTVATMAKVSASYQPLSAARACTAVSANGTLLPNLNIKTVTRGEFADRVLNGGLLSDEIYQVSSDAIDAFGDRIVCLGDGVDAWDAATYGQLLSVKSEADGKADISGQIFSGEIAAPQISGTSVSAGTGGFTSVRLSVSNIYERIRNGGVRFVNSPGSKYSTLYPDGSNVATMAKISAAYQPLTLAVSGHGNEITLSADRITVVNGTAVNSVSATIPSTAGNEMRLCELLITGVSADGAVSLTHPAGCLLGSGADSIETGANHFVYAEYARDRWLVTKTVFTES